MGIRPLVLEGWGERVEMLSFIDLDVARAAALRELRAFVALCASLTEDDASRPTRCPGWSVRDLVEHVAGVPGYDYFAGRLRRARLGIVDEASATNSSTPPTGLSWPKLVDVLKQRTDEFASELELLTSDDLERRLLIIPGRTQAVRNALGQYVWEFGVHRYDLETALGNHFDLPPDVCRGVVLMAETNSYRDHKIEGHVPRSATPAPEEAVSYVLVGDTIRWEFSFTPGVPRYAASPTRNGNWSAGAVHERCCTVRGTDSAICLVLCGRLSTHDDRVAATEDFEPRTFTVW